MVAGEEIPPYKDRDAVKTRIDLKGQLILDSTSTSLSLISTALCGILIFKVCRIFFIFFIFLQSW